VQGEGEGFTGSRAGLSVKGLGIGWVGLYSDMRIRSIWKKEEMAWNAISIPGVGGIEAIHKRGAQ
jgi:hypothetical protein